MLERFSAVEGRAADPLGVVQRWFCAIPHEQLVRVRKA
jgi:hypothetical protein